MEGILIGKLIATSAKQIGMFLVILAIVSAAIVAFIIFTLTLGKIPDLRALRRDKIGFVFQAPYLIPFLDVTDNVALLPMLAGQSNAESRKRALEFLEALDVAHRAKAMISQLSGSEQQRVSIARALVNRPPVILADEPTAPLDSERAMAVIRILNEMAIQYETAIIVVTHDEKIIPTFKRIYHIRDGKTQEEAGEGRAREMLGLNHRQGVDAKENREKLPRFG
jgi:putative ABC transport system ATP-binding protein